MAAQLLCLMLIGLFKVKLESKSRLPILEFCGSLLNYSSIYLTSNPAICPYPGASYYTVFVGETILIFE